MPRPRKAAVQKRSAQIGVRFTAAELAKLTRAAGKAGLPVAALIRRRALSVRITVKQTRAIDWQTYDQLRRIGVNLNQALRLAHSLQEIPRELVSAASLVERVITEEIERLGPEGRR